MRIAVIPARGGSKRIPRKNIKNFCGKPMIIWAIETAKLSGMFDSVIVSTDDAEIAELSQKCGADIPFRRPENLANDVTPTVPVIAHAVGFCLQNGMHITHACCIYPCAPFLQVGDLVNAYELMEASAADFVYPVTEYVHPVQRAMRRLVDGKMEFISQENELARTQDLETLYHDAGQFYWGKASAWLANKKMHTDGIGMPIPHWRVVDIDTDDDWKRAEAFYKASIL
jgi:pseudaminic acid cytidylyltransferase